jgi:transcriptional regulator with XRE-family HTH domain
VTDDRAVAGPGEYRSRPLLRTMLGEVLRRTRLDQGRTLAEVAADASVSMPYLSELERGLKEASSEVLAAVCDALEIDLADVLAQIGSDLVQDRVRQMQIVRLGSAGGFSAQPRPGLPSHRSQPRASAQPSCLLAA